MGRLLFCPGCQALQRGLYLGEAAAAVILPIKAQLLCAFLCPLEPRPKVSNHRLQPMGMSHCHQSLIAHFMKLMGRHRQGGGDMGKAGRLGRIARLCQPKAIAGPATRLPLEPLGRHRALPSGAVLLAFHHVDALLSRPPLKHLQPVVVLGHRLDIGIGPKERGGESLALELSHRLQRARPTAHMHRNGRQLAIAAIAPRAPGF